MQKGMITAYDLPTGKGCIAAEDGHGLTYRPFHCSNVADHSILTPGVRVTFELDHSNAAVDVELERP